MLMGASIWEDFLVPFRMLWLTIVCAIACTLNFGLRDATAQGTTVEFCCSVAALCHYKVRYSTGGERNFTLRGPGRDRIPNMNPSRDVYCVCVNSPVPANGCSVPGYFCKGYIPVRSDICND